MEEELAENNTNQEKNSSPGSLAAVVLLDLCLTQTEAGDC